MMPTSMQLPTHGAVAAGAPAAARAGAAMLRSGGNVADAAVAAALAMTVADPANASLLGRCQIVLRDPAGRFEAIDGASAAPAALPGDLGDGPLAHAAVPGLPQALERLHACHGRLSLDVVTGPAVRMAEEGVRLGPHLASIWAHRAADLAAGGAGVYLDDSGHPPARLCHGALAGLLRAFGKEGSAALMRGAVAQRLAAGVRARGGHWRAEDLAANAARTGEVLHGRFRDVTVTTLGRQGWGHSLLQMLAILDYLPRFGPVLTGVEACRLMAVIETCFADRPQRLGSLTPKADGLALETLIASHFVASRVEAITARLAGPRPAPPQIASPGILPVEEDQDTTHLSVLDTEGFSVALTQSVGPHFGLRACEPTFGLLPAKSYRMESDPTPGARDITEMCPVIVMRGDRVVVSLGAAGSERIPVAVLQVIVNMIDRGLDIAEAVNRPRVSFKDGRPRIHAAAGGAVADALRAYWPHIDISRIGHENHLGLVHAVGTRTDGRIIGAADPSWDGAAEVVPIPGRS